MTESINKKHIDNVVKWDEVFSKDFVDESVP